MSSRISPPLLIGSNIVLDALGTATFSAGIGFFAVNVVGASASLTLLALTVGGLAGVLAGLPLSSVVESLDIKRTLIVVQVAQAVTYAVMLAVPAPDVFLVLAGAGLGLSRVLSPVRGALPPLFLGADEILVFKARVKTWTVLAAVIGAALAAILGVLAIPSLLFVIPALNSVSYVAAIVLTLALPRIQAVPNVRATRFYRPPPWLLGAVVLVSMLVSLAAVPEYSISLLVASDSRIPAVAVWLLPVVGLSLALTGAQILKRQVTGIIRHALQLVVLSVVASFLAIGLMMFLRYIGLAGWASLLVIGLAGLCSEGASLLASYLVWDIQYAAGRRGDQAAIVGVFTTGTSLGLVVAPAIASGLLFSGIVSTGILLGALILMFVAAGVAAVRVLRRGTPELAP